jgi:hypothetical protein
MSGAQWEGTVDAGSCGRSFNVTRTLLIEAADTQSTATSSAARRAGVLPDTHQPGVMNRDLRGM